MRDAKHVTRLRTTLCLAMCASAITACVSDPHQCSATGPLPKSQLLAMASRLYRPVGESDSKAGYKDVGPRIAAYRYIKSRSDPTWIPLPSMDNGYMLTLRWKLERPNGERIDTFRYASVDKCGFIWDTSGI